MYLVCTCVYIVCTRMYLACTRMSDVSYHKLFGPLLLCSCDVFRALINSFCLLISHRRMPQVKISHRKVNAICCIYMRRRRGGCCFCCCCCFCLLFCVLILYVVVVVVVFLPGGGGGGGGRVSWLVGLMGEDECSFFLSFFSLSFFFFFFFPFSLFFLCSAISH